MLMVICLIFLGIITLNGLCRMESSYSLGAVFRYAELDIRLLFMEIVKPFINSVNRLNIPAEILIVAENIGYLVEL